MGGLGSTRWGGHQRQPTVEEVQSVTIAHCRGLRDLPAGRRLLVAARFGGRQADEAVTLDPAPQPFGGHRWWFVCPSCEHRRGRLFRLPSGLACRVCSRVGYRVCRMDRIERLRHRATKALSRLAGARPPVIRDIDDPVPTRPKGMHRRRYNAEREGFEAARGVYQEVWWAETVSRFGHILGR